MAIRKRKPVEEWQRKDAVRLKGIFENRVKDMTQDEFGDRFEIGTQGMVWQYLSAHTPLNHTVAYKFAKGIGCSIAEFSPRLAGEIALFAEFAYEAKSAKAKS